METGTPHERLAELARLWGVSIGRIRVTPSSIIGFGLCGAAPVVLKVVSHPHEEWRAGEVISAYGGHGLVRALEHAPGAVLLEEIRPGNCLADVIASDGDERAISALGSVIGAMLETAPSINGYPSARHWGAAFDRFLESGRVEIPSLVVEEASQLYEYLCRTQDPPRLLHGDLQHYNVLLDEHRGWVAIDPKGVVAELEFELGPALRNPGQRPELYTTAALERRAKAYARRLDLDAERILKWTLAQAVLSAIWTIEDSGSIEPNADALQVAASARRLLA